MSQTLSSRLNVGVAQIVVPGTSSGLVSASGLTGNTTGSAIAAGFVGEELISVIDYSGVSAGTTGQWFVQNTITLNQGIYDFSATMEMSATGTGLTNFGIIFSTATGNNTTGTVFPRMGALQNCTSSAQPKYACVTPFQVIVASASTNFYLKTRVDYSGGTPTYNYTYRVVRRA